MYHCWKTHHLPPSTYYNMSFGEKAILTAFFLREMEEIQEQNESMDSGTTSGFSKTAYVSDEELINEYGERPDNI